MDVSKKLLQRNKMKQDAGSRIITDLVELKKNISIFLKCLITALLL